MWLLSQVIKSFIESSIWQMLQDYGTQVKSSLNNLKIFFSIPGNSNRIIRSFVSKKQQVLVKQTVFWHTQCQSVRENPLNSRATLIRVLQPNQGAYCLIRLYRYTLIKIITEQIMRHMMLSKWNILMKTIIDAINC